MKIFLAFFLLLISSCEKANNSSWSSVNQPVTDATIGSEQFESNTVDEFMVLINSHRARLGLDSLVHDESLRQIAQRHSERMASGTVAFGHDGFSNRCAEARSALGGGNLCSENVATGQKTVTAVFKAWIDSPGHRENIEEPRVTHTGLGYKKSSNGSLYWTQIFLEVNLEVGHERQGT